MFKKIDYLIIRAYIGPFILAFAVITFILLLHFMLGYISELIGKDLGFWVYAKLIGYFSFNVMPMAFPLAILISSLVAYGNLGEHFELTALKASGISLLRTLRPIFLFILLVTALAFYISNTILPYANLKAYSLLWDAKTKKPSVSFTEGYFYYGLDGYAIKVGKKLNEVDFKNIIINNFSAGRGNAEVILAKSGKIETTKDKSYLKLDLFQGNSYSEVYDQETHGTKKEFVRTSFDSSSIMFSLESFKMNKTDENLFKSNEVMMSVQELSHASDSLQKLITLKINDIKPSISMILPYQNKKLITDSSKKAFSGFIPPKTQYDPRQKVQIYNTALNNARNVKNIIISNTDSLKYHYDTKKDFDMEFWMKFTHATACIIMFLIGAPLGAIIKKGGLGVPLLVSVIFFMVFYICTLLGKQLVRESDFNIYLGMWLADIILLPFGIIFLIQAKNDSRIFEFDFLQKINTTVINKLRLQKIDNLLVNDKPDIDKIVLLKSDDEMSEGVRHIEEYLHLFAREKGLDNLTKEQKNLLYIAEFESIMYNEGFAHYFYSAFGSITEETLVSLKTIGAYKTADILQKAIEQFPNQLVHKDITLRREALKLVSDAGRMEWKQLETIYSKFEEDIMVMKINYIKNNRTKF